MWLFQVKKVQEHAHDFTSLPVLIAKKTVTIRNMQRDLAERFPHKNQPLKVWKRQMGGSGYWLEKPGYLRLEASNRDYLWIINLTSDCQRSPKTFKHSGCPLWNPIKLKPQSSVKHVLIIRHCDSPLVHVTKNILFFSTFKISVELFIFHIIRF